MDNYSKFLEKNNETTQMVLAVEGSGTEAGMQAVCAWSQTLAFVIIMLR